MKQKILEIGSGNSPRATATVLTDRYLYDNSQRAGTYAIHVDRPFVVANGYRLPFKDREFDFVICSHVLEHVKDPIAFVKEMERVGKSGYIEVPNIYAERLFGWDFHLWYCEIKKKTLIFHRKKEGLRHGGFFHQLIASHIWFRRFFEENESFFYIKYTWQKKVSITVSNETLPMPYLVKIDRQLWSAMENINKSIVKDSVFYCKWFFKRIKRKINKELKSILWWCRTTFMKQYVIASICTLLQCPHCLKGSITKRKNYVQCMMCKYRYPIDKYIPIMLVKNERKKGY